MPKPFTYRAITANCGNDGIGNKAAGQITQLLTAGQGLDFIVINCQEVDFEKTRRQLSLLAKEKGYSVQCVAKMATHTKPSTLLHSGTGIATFVLHQSDLTIHTESSKGVRRAYQRLGGTAYNKGGVVTEFTVTRNEDAVKAEHIKIQAISGHLDSQYNTKRNEDWANLHKARSTKRVESWDELAAAIPHLTLSGYDANTRKKIVEGGKGINLIEELPDDPEVQVLCRAPFAEQCFSADITYQKSLAEDSKRPGYLAYGMLDYVGISDGSEPQLHINTKHSTLVDKEPSTKRDHAVVISPMQEYIAPKSSFEVVKNQIASRLHHVAPELARQVRNLKEDDEHSKSRLINVYNEYLSIDGVLNKAIVLHSNKFECFDTLMKAEFLQDNEIKKQLAAALFKNTRWCEGAVEKLIAKQQLAVAFINSLSSCQHEAGVNARINWYHELEAKIDSGSKINPEQEFKRRAINEYIEMRSKLVEALNYYSHQDNPLRQNFQESGVKVLACLDAIAIPDTEELSKQDLDAKSLEMLTRIADNCQKACMELHSKTDNMSRIANELNELSQEAGSNTSMLWKALNAVLNIFIKVAIKIAGVSPEKLNPLYSKEDHLAHSITNYKSAFHELQTKSEPDSDLKEKAEKDGSMTDDQYQRPTNP